MVHLCPEPSFEGFVPNSSPFRAKALGGVLRSEHGGGSCAALCETAYSAKLPALQHWLKYKCVCVREGEKNAWGDEKG